MSKKMLIGIGLIVAAIMLFLVGCDDTDTKPNNWNVVSNNNWKYLETGIIKEKILHRNKLCDKFPECEPNCLNHGSFFSLIFGNGNEYLIGHLERYGIINKGQYGTLYKHDIGSDDINSWFQWRVLIDKKESQKEPIAYSKKPPVETKKPEIKYSWKNAKNVLPKPHITVIVRLKGDIITTAHVNQKKDWKLESNKEKTLGGLSLYSVVEWQELDLE